MFDRLRSWGSRTYRRLTRRSREWGEGDEDWLMDLGTPSGVKLSRKTAYSVSSWFRAIQILSSTVAKTPIECLDVSSGKNIPDPLHAVSLLLSGHGKPNDETLRYHFIQTLTAHAAGHGGGYAYIYRDKRGRPVELLQLRPDRTYPLRENGKLMFVTTIGGDYGTSGVETLKLLGENVLHIHGLGYDGLSGYSLMQLASRALGSAVAKEEFGSRFFKNSATPSVAIKVPKKLSPQAFKNLQSSWVKLRTGLENAHKPVILEDGAELEPFSHSAGDSQLIQAMEQDPVLVSNFTGVPPHLLGVKGYNSYNSLEIQSQDLLDYAIDPLFVPWEQEMAEKLLKEDEKARYSRVVQFKRSKLVRVDFTKRYSGYRTALGGFPFRTPNEVRMEEGEQPVEGYDFIPVPLNMSSTPDNTDPEKPVDGGLTNPDGSPATNPDGSPLTQQNSDTNAKALRSLFESTAKRMVTRLHSAAVRKSAIDENEHRAVVLESFAPLLVLARSAITAEAISVEMFRSLNEAIATGQVEQWRETTGPRVLKSVFDKAKQ
jgi:HK97 family phage portal protein